MSDFIEMMYDMIWYEVMWYVVNMMSDVVLSTAHKAKGLEFDTVRLTEDYLPPDAGMGNWGLCPPSPVYTFIVTVTDVPISLKTVH